LSLTFLTNENQLCTNGTLRSDELHLVLANSTTLQDSVKQIAIFFVCILTTLQVAHKIDFWQISCMPLDYTVRLTSYDKQNFASRMGPFTVSWCYNDWGAWSWHFTAETYVRFHAIPCWVLCRAEWHCDGIFPVCLDFRQLWSFH
jgi:hypothetical protein